MTGFTGGMDIGKGKNLKPVPGDKPEELLKAEGLYVEKETVPAVTGTV
jgi:hypothetical protein